jgi:hypothetical protein
MSLLEPSGVRGQSSVLAAGTWYKVSVSRHGVYKIDYNTFKKMGFSPAKTDPRKIRIYGNEGGMLPQANNVTRPTDLTELAIVVHGEEDGEFNAGDFILFYAHGADRYHLDVNKEIFFYEKNLYADRNFYFVTVSASNGKRVEETTVTPGSYPVITTGETFVYHEVDAYSELKSGREWFGERFETTLSQNFDVEMPDIVSGSNLRLVSDVMAQAFLTSTFTVTINGTAAGTQPVAPIPNTTYGEKGRHKRDTFAISANAAGAPGKSLQRITYNYTKATSGKSVGFLDFFLLQGKQTLKLRGTQTSFRSLASLNQPISTFQLQTSATKTRVWDVTDPYEPVAPSISVANETITFHANSSALREYVAFTENVNAPALEGRIAQQDLHGMATPNLLIVTHPDFVSEAQRLADHRSQFSNWSVRVVSTTEVYHEFSSGRQDVTAIRDLAKHLYDKNPGTFQALLLFGKTSYDYKGILPDNINKMPTYESRNSLHPLQTYSSDDYFGFLEINEGAWSESPVVNHTLDIGVGRLPVKTKSEARIVVDKIIRYETSAELVGAWRKNITFVADDGNSVDGYSSQHQSQADELAEYLEAENPAFDTKKIFLGTFQKTVSVGGETVPAMRTQIENAFEEGSLIINFTGHGSERVWCDERVLDDALINNLKNERLPFLVTATCEFGRQDDPQFISSAEMAVLHATGGAVGLVTTARPVGSSTNFLLNEAFYEALLQTHGTADDFIGEIFRRTKNNSISGVSNRNFSLMGDPSMRLAVPRHTVKINNIKTSTESTVLKALSTVTVTGEIQGNDAQKDESFNGTLIATLFDKETDFTTIGRNDPAFQFSQWYNALYRGKAVVDNGEFSFSFIVPKNIAYVVDQGKLSAYAFHDDGEQDAAGASTAFTVGSSEPIVDPDNTAPTLQAFIGDETFINGGIASRDTRLIVKLQDASGMNISGYGVGNSLAAILDEAASFSLNNYYVADANDFTSGTVVFPLKDLTPGKHTIVVRAWDTHNNSSSTAVDFVVPESSGLTIESFGNYPNPFQDASRLFFRHNRSGDDLEAELTIYGRAGEIVYTRRSQWLSSPYEIELLEILPESNLVKNHGAGLYFARLILRSLSDGSKSEQVAKLIILK